MSLSDCEKCWNTPCTCGWGYRDWSMERKLELAAVLFEEYNPKRGEMTIGRKVNLAAAVLGIDKSVLHRLVAFKVGDRVKVNPLRLPNGDLAPNRNFTDPFEGRIMEMTAGDSGLWFIVKDSKGNNFSAEFEQLEHI